jgi:spermidine synthase
MMSAAGRRRALGSGGVRIELLADAERPGGLLLLIDRVRQSYVDTEDPTYLDFEYMRWFSDILTTLEPGPRAATHIGGGAMTMPRWLDAQWPGSTHIVFEPDTEVTALVRARAPFPRSARVRVRPVPGREGLAGLRADSADLVILDAFAGFRVPADLTTAESFADIARVLRPEGLFLANLADRAPFGYARRVAAGARAAIGAPVAISEKRIFGGARFGNLVLAARRGRLDARAIRRNLALEVVVAQLRAGRAMDDWIGGARPFSDADAQRSPEPPQTAWD